MAPIDFQLVTGSIESPPQPPCVVGYGAMLEFLGVVRPSEQGKSIAAIDYEAYPAMAQKQGMKLVSEIAAKHKLLALHVIHRIGIVPCGEISLRVRVWSSHRGEGFAACSELIERLKQDIPIWKHPRES